MWGGVGVWVCVCWWYVGRQEWVFKNSMLGKDSKEAQQLTWHILEPQNQFGLTAHHKVCVYV